MPDADPKLIHRIDKWHMEFPFEGSRMLQGLLVQKGFKVGRLHVATLPLVTLLRNAQPVIDGKGTWRDNDFVERLWRTIKYEEVYQHAYASVPEARASIGRYLGVYNSRRPHSSLDGRTPDQAFFNQPMPEAVAVAVAVAA